jgi:hypothetical protein
MSVFKKFLLMVSAAFYDSVAHITLSPEMNIPDINNTTPEGKWGL